MRRTPLVELPPQLAPGMHPAAREDARFLLGIDGGATKTLAAVLDRERGEVHLGHAGPSNEDVVGAEQAVTALLDAADAALAAAGAPERAPDAAVVAVAG